MIAETIPTPEEIAALIRSDLPPLIRLLAAEVREYNGERTVNAWPAVRRVQRLRAAARACESLADVESAHVAAHHARWVHEESLGGIRGSERIALAAGQLARCLEGLSDGDVPPARLGRHYKEALAALGRIELDPAYAEEA